MSTDRIAVIGSGPAGLLCAYAANQAGYLVEIFTNQDQPTTQAGAQYLHRAIPGLTDDLPMEIVKYWRTGTAECYSEKIYGKNFPPEDTSWGKFKSIEQCWDLRHVYAKLWDMFKGRLTLRNIDLLEINRLAPYFSLMFSTMPLDKLIDPGQEHRSRFETQLVYCYPADLIRASGPGNHIVYNGDDDDAWYRTSRIFGSSWTEWPSSVGEDHTWRQIEKDLRTKGVEFDSFKLWQAVKPIKHHYNIGLMLPPNVILAGRYGMWQKNILTHDAYQRACEVIQVWQDA
jgi:hypothetical protein